MVLSSHRESRGANAPASFTSIHSVNFPACGRRGSGMLQAQVCLDTRKSKQDDETQCSRSLRRCDDTAVSSGMSPTSRYLGHGTRTDINKTGLRLFKTTSDCSFETRNQC